MDSYVTIAVVNKYLPLTINQAPAVDIYEKAQGWSKKFKEMCDKLYGSTNFLDAFNAIVSNWNMLDENQKEEICQLIAGDKPTN